MLSEGLREAELFKRRWKTTVEVSIGDLRPVYPQSHCLNLGLKLLYWLNVGVPDLTISHFAPGLVLSGHICYMRVNCTEHAHVSST